MNVPIRIHTVQRVKTSHPLQVLENQHGSALVLGHVPHVSPAQLIEIACKARLRKLCHVKMSAPCGVPEFEVRDFDKDGWSESSTFFPAKVVSGNWDVVLFAPNDSLMLVGPESDAAEEAVVVVCRNLFMVGVSSLEPQSKLDFALEAFQ